jgi:hypothetical protein
VEWVALGALAVAVIAVTALVATGRLELTPLSDPVSTLPPFEMPAHPTSVDVDPIRLGTTFYGYAPAEVDAALDARRERLSAQERELSEQAEAPAHREGHVHPDA